MPEYITNFYIEFPYPFMLVTQKVNTDPESTLGCLPVNTKLWKKNPKKPKKNQENQLMGFA